MEKPECFGAKPRYLNLNCRDCDSYDECRKAIDGRPECFGKEYNPNCNDCTVGLECEKYSRKLEQEKTTRYVQVPEADKVKALDDGIRIVRETEVIAENAAIAIFTDQVREPLKKLSEHLGHIYPDRKQPQSFENQFRGIAQTALDIILDNL